MNRMRSELHMQATTMKKLKNELSNARQLYATTAEQLRKVKVEKIALEMEKKVLEYEKAELQKQVNTISNPRVGADSISDWRKVTKFWARVGAKTMVRNAVCAPKLKD